MKKEKLINAVEKIEDRFISEAEVYDPEKAKKTLSPGFFIIPAAAAASVALILGVNSIYDNHDPLSNPEINNYPASDTAVVSGSFTTDASGYTGTQITYQTGNETVSEVIYDTVTVSETDITAGTETDAVKTEGSVASAPPSAQKTERQEPAPETVRKTEPPVTERQIRPEPPPVTEVSTESYSKPQPPVTTEEHASKPEPPQTTEEEPVNPEPPSTTAENEKETPEPPTTTEFVQPAPGLKPQPLSFGNYDEAIQAVNTYDLNDYAEYCKDAYEKMFGRIISDGFVYAPDDTENDLLNTEKSRVTIRPYSAYEDIAVGCIAEYDASQFQTTFCCADRDVLASCADQTEYFRNRLNQEFEISWQNGGREIFIKDIGVWHCAYAFIDDEHYYIIRTQDSEEALLRFVSNVNFKKIPLY